LEKYYFPDEQFVSTQNKIVHERKCSDHCMIQSVVGLMESVCIFKQRNLKERDIKQNLDVSGRVILIFKKVKLFP
jgi:hypothetical protein